MQSNARLTTGLLAALLLLLTLGLGFLATENRRMKDVLIDHTLTQLERQYEDARVREEEHIITLRASLEEALGELSTLRGLSAQEMTLIDTAISLTDRILEAATSQGIHLE
jgi:hypothetical protein